MNALPRRRFLAGSFGAILAANREDQIAEAAPSDRPRLTTRGVVLVPEDLTLADWPQRAKAAGLTTIGLHHQNSPRAVIRCVQSDGGQRLLEQCRTFGLEIETVSENSASLRSTAKGC